MVSKTIKELALLPVLCFVLVWVAFGFTVAIIVTIICVVGLFLLALAIGWFAAPVVVGALEGGAALGAEGAAAGAAERGLFKKMMGDKLKSGMLKMGEKAKGAASIDIGKKLFGGGASPAATTAGAAAAGAAAGAAVAKASKPAAAPHAPTNFKTFSLQLLFIVAGTAGLAYFLKTLGLEMAPAVLSSGILGLLAFGAMHGVGLCTVILVVLGVLAAEGAVFLFFSFLPVPAIFTTIMIIFIALLSFGIPGPGGRPTKAIGLTVILFTLLLGFLAYGTTTFRAYFTAGSLLQKSLEAQKESWSEVWTAFRSSLPGLIQQSQLEVQRTISIATGDYEEGVEAQSTRQLGVFLEGLGLVNNKVPANDVVDLFARLRAESFTTTDRAEQLNITLTCRDERTNKTGSIRPQDKFSIEEYELFEIDCLFDARELTVGSNTLALEATFDFKTSAYVKSYFMDQETIRSYRRQQQDPLTAFQIADKDPLAVYTPGPMRIGMKAGQQPIPLVFDREEGPTLTLTIERGWLDGQLVALRELKITVPAGLAMREIAGDDPGTACTTETAQEQTCTFGLDYLKTLYTKDDLTAPFKTIRITTSLKDAAKLLGNAPLGIRSFKTEISYTYRIKKTQSVTVTEAV